MMITILGTATLDIILKSKEIDKISQGSKLDIDEVFFSLGGGALNAATTFKNLGLAYKAYFRLGNDLIGKIISQGIKKEKIKAKIFYHQGGSQFSLVLLGVKGERTIFVYRGRGDHFNIQELSQVTLSDYYYLTTANTKPQVFKNFLRRIKTKAKLIALNPSRKFLENQDAFSALSFVDILFLNDKEASIFLKKKDHPLNLGQEISKNLKNLILVLTLGERGSLTFFADKIFQAGVFKPKKFVDTTGAGDAFASAFFASLILDLESNKEINEELIKKAITWGSANASANIEKLGAQIGLLKKKDYQKYKNLRIKII